jgi:hypothetical protein
MNQQNVSKSKSLENHEAFYFNNSVDSYTGHKACSVQEFVKELVKVDLKSLEFHLMREDFEKWFTASLKDNALAKKVEVLRKQKLTGQTLRTRLYKTVMQHIVALRKPIKSPQINRSSVQRKKLTVNKKPLLATKVVNK